MGKTQPTVSRLELVSTLHLIESYFPRQGGLIDIGDGPGRYTLELMKRGYRMTLVDLSLNAISFATEELARLGFIPEATLCADAHDLSAFPDVGFDGALLMGPMYHITEERGR